MVILVGPVPEGADGPIPVEVDTELGPGGSDDLDAIYGDESTRAGAARHVYEIAQDAYSDGLALARRCADDRPRARREGIERGGRCCEVVAQAVSVPGPHERAHHSPSITPSQAA